MLVSWLQDGKFWKDGGRKLGINLPKVRLVDALSLCSDFDSRSLLKVEDMILNAIKDATTNAPKEGKIILILDGLDFLQAATTCQTPELLDMIRGFQEVCCHQRPYRLTLFH